MFDVKQAIAEATAEVDGEQIKAAKGKIKDSLRRIASAKAVQGDLVPRLCSQTDLLAADWGVV